MKTAQAIPSAAAFDVVLDAVHDTARRMPDTSALMAELRRALASATEWVSGVAPELQRARCLAEATDPADVERRAQAWERAQETRRALPPAL